VEQAFLVQISRSFRKIDSLPFATAIGSRPGEVVLLEAKEKVSGAKRFGDRSGRAFGFAASRRASPFHDWNSEKYDFTVVLLQKKRQSAAGSASLTNQLNYISAP
jgi:hypothetical protein